MRIPHTVLAMWPAKIISLSILCLSLLACFGDTTSNAPVIYNHPQTSIVYHNNPTWLPDTRIQFELVFPDGLPAQANTRIELNGINIAPEFDDWGVSEINVVKLGANGSYTALLFPTVASAIKPGANTFQLTAPVRKKLVYFQVDLGGAEIFITEWHDTYCGFSPTNTWLLPWKMNDSCVIDGVTGKEVNPDTQATRHAGANVFVRGYIEDNTAEGFTMPWALEINRIRVDVNGNQTYAAWNPSMNRTVDDGRWGDPVAGIPTGSGENEMYAYFGSSGAMCNYYLKYMIDSSTGVAYTPAQYQQTFNLAPNEFCAFFPDNDAAGNEMGAIEFKTTDNMGIIAQTYLRSHVPIKDSRLDRNSPSTVVAGVGVRLGEPTILAVLEALSTTIELTGNLLPSPTNIVTLFGVTVRLSALYLPALDLDFTMPSTSGRLQVHTRIDGTRAIITQSSSCNIFNIIICGPLSAIIGGGITAIVSGDIYMDIDVGVNDASSPSNPNMAFANLAMDIPNMSIALDLGSGIGASIVEAILNPLIGFLDGFIVNLLDGIISSIVGNIVNGYINNDIPKLRLALPLVDENGQSYSQYLGLKPEIEYLTSSPSTYNASEMGMDVELGFHTKANPRINKSPGALFDENAQLMSARMARTVGGQNAASAGIALSSNFLNQLFMGLWESGILAWNFNTGNQPLINTFLNNTDVKFLSATPWAIELISPSDSEYAKGNFRIRINDLNVAFEGDIFDPFLGRWFYDRTFFEMNIFVDAVVRLNANNGQIKINFDAVPFAYVSEFSSDYLPVNKSMANSVLADILPLAASELESIQVGFPEIIGAQIQFKDIWVENSNNLAMTFDITID